MSQRPLKDVLLEIAAHNDSEGQVREHSYAGLDDSQKAELNSNDIQVYEGKVRQCLFNGKAMQIVHTDRLTAFDRLIGQVPYKGNMLTTITSFWFEQVNKILPSHFESQSHARVIKAKRLEPIKAEVIVRGYLAGSMMRAYEKGERDFCGETLPEGLTGFGKLSTPIVTPTSKAEVFEHDENRTPAQLISEGVCTKEEWTQISEMALKIFALGQKIYAEKGWILVDTKYEFGRYDNGKIFVIDEVHTPDSSRLWVESTYADKIAKKTSPDMLDKEIVRRELLDKGFSGEGDVPKISAKSITELGLVYLNVAETLTGKPMMVDGVGSKVAVKELGIL